MDKLEPHPISQYYVFLASPGDVEAERQAVRRFFEKFNRQIAPLWNARFEVVDWENYATIGVGDVQQLISRQTLERFQHSLALVIGVMAQRFGTATSRAESGTEEEFNWAMQSHETLGHPEIKWFFRQIRALEVSLDRAARAEELAQWERVIAFRERMRDLKKPVFYSEYPSAAGFAEVLENDLQRWLVDANRPWVRARPQDPQRPTTIASSARYFEKLERDFRRLDIAGIDNERAFEIPLSEIYVKLRVIFDIDTAEPADIIADAAIDIQTALLRYPKLVIVGDPGSGKSTFLKYIALMIARAVLAGDSNIALNKLSLPDPLPLPVFLSCWDLADFLKSQPKVSLDSLRSFIRAQLERADYALSPDELESVLSSGQCCLLFDGLDEVPTDNGRAIISRLLEDCVQRYGNNRFVVTSRIRAYTGDTMLASAFTRCDIQAFDKNDRAEFIRNWVALLFSIPPQGVETEGGEAAAELTNLLSAIEGSDRIRPLAVNPLLLTVIAIVHWNRKRLPEQRGDLYDECVDVLLGQRKEAEIIRRNRQGAALDQRVEEVGHEELAWVRKRFAEIALHILSQDRGRAEASKRDVIKLLIPRFLDKGADTPEQAAARAELFLDRQELRSGLLVSRRGQSYRFVHLTFQEYLAAWQLSNLDFEQVTELIRPRLRSAKWFECLQLLGGQWAKESDDKADRYIAWLLANLGTRIPDQAPVVALCANLVKDISGVAELKPATRAGFRRSVEATLDAFRYGSGVPLQTQLEILEALGTLGAVVKSHLIDATRASLFQVRRRAVRMLLRHLSDDELFGLTHLLEDQSYKPVVVYLQALIERDRKRTEQLLNSHEQTQVITLGMRLLPSRCHESFTDNLARRLLETQVGIPGHWGSRERNAGLRRLAKDWWDEATQDLVCRFLLLGPEDSVRSYALQILIDRWSESKARDFVETEARNGEFGVVGALSERWQDERTRTLLFELATTSSVTSARTVAAERLTDVWKTESHRLFVMTRAVEDPDESVREKLTNLVAKQWPDQTTRDWLRGRVRAEHFVVAVLGGLHSDFGRVVFRRSLIGPTPYFPPDTALSREQIKKAASWLVPDDEIGATVESLSKHVGWDITKGLKT